MANRFVGATLLVALVPYLAGCHKRVSVEPAALNAVPQERIVALTTTDGVVIDFAPSPASVRNGVVYGTSTTGTYEIPESQVTRRLLTKDRILSVTTADGKTVHFERPGATVRDGVISGQVKKPFVHEIPLDKVQHLWIERTDTGKTILAVIGILAGAFGVLAAIVAATKESCPFVYSWDGARYVFDAEPYGGAITRGLERDDYAELEHLREQDGQYRLLLTNEVDETQFTNFMELWVVDHAPGLRVVSDENGGLQGFERIEPPGEAEDRYGNDLSPWLRSTDRRVWEPEAVAGPGGDLRQTITLTLPKPESAVQANLIANVATGLWGSYMIKQLVELHGRDTAGWLASLDQDPAAVRAVHAWGEREGTYRLPIEVEESEGWVVRATLPPGGPLLAEDRLITLDVSHTARANQLRLRLRPTVGFWAFNSLAVAYGKGQTVPIVRVAPKSARTPSGSDILADLSAIDNRYYSMPSNADRAEILFPAPPMKPGSERTVFLHSRGWYQLHLRNDGEPDETTFTRVMTVPGAAAQFAADRFAEWKRAMTQ
jgi:hypothetical protein